MQFSLEDMLNQYTANEKTLESIGLPKAIGTDSPSESWESSEDIHKVRFI